MSRHLLHRHRHRDRAHAASPEDQHEEAHEAPATGEEGARQAPATGGEEIYEAPATGAEAARERFGGANPGAVFFGWLVAVGVTIVLAGILGAIAAAIGESIDLTRDDIEGRAGDLGVGAVVALMIVLFIGYTAGGYVAGRMSRYDGARQGFGVWLLGLIVTLVAIGLGALFGTQYDVLDRIDLPRIPYSDGELTAGGVVAGLLVLAVTLIGALLGGITGHRYHDRVDRVALSSEPE